MSAFVFILGLTIGSFLNVLIDRLPQGRSIFWGRSKCDHCHKTLRWFELIPVLSFFIQGGRCRRCHRVLSIQYPLVELLTAIGITYLFLVFSKSLSLSISSSLVFSSLLVIFFADLKYQIIPDSMVVIGLLGSIGILIATSMSMIAINIITGLASSCFFLFFWYFTHGRGMGLGDVKLALLLGFLLGFPKIVVALYIAFLTGAAYGVILILIGKKSLKTRIAFGPFLVLGTLITIIWGGSIIAWWKGLL